MLGILNENKIAKDIAKFYDNNVFWTKQQTNTTTKTKKQIGKHTNPC